MKKVKLFMLLVTQWICFIVVVVFTLILLVLEILFRICTLNKIKIDITDKLHEGAIWVLQRLADKRIEILINKNKNK